MILSILVPTLKCREAYFAALCQCLAPQLGSEIVLLALMDDGAEPTGVKRNRLLEAVESPYVAFIDDDDLIPGDYGALVLEALKSAPDVVGFKLKLYEDGEYAGTVVHSFSHRDDNAIRHRTPTHLNPIRTGIARTIGFPNQNCGEDVIYAERLPRLMSEVFIDREMYFYFRRNDLRHEKHNHLP